jgi:hypothetical protein
MAGATNTIMQNPVFRVLVGLVFLIGTYFCVATVYYTASIHDYAGAGAMLAIAGLAIFTAFWILPLGKIVDSWVFLVFVEIVMFVAGSLSLASIYWAIKGGNYIIALIALVAGGGDLLLAISMALQARNMLKQR